MVEGKTPVKIYIDEEHLEGVVIDELTYQPFTTYTETRDFTYSPEVIDKLMKDKYMSGSNDKTKIVREPRPLHYTFYEQPNGNGMNREMYRQGMNWSKDYKETKRRVKHIALPHRIRRTVLHFMAKARRLMKAASYVKSETN
jgi:hypothetical protein